MRRVTKLILGGRVKSGRSEEGGNRVDMRRVTVPI
jgi:hypothetical protein